MVISFFTQLEIDGDQTGTQVWNTGFVKQGGTKQ